MSADSDNDPGHVLRQRTRRLKYHHPLFGADRMTRLKLNRRFIVQ